jgi:hypothetical protein
MSCSSPGASLEPRIELSYFYLGIDLPVIRHRKFLIGMNNGGYIFI